MTDNEIGLCLVGAFLLLTLGPAALHAWWRGRVIRQYEETGTSDQYRWRYWWFRQTTAIWQWWQNRNRI